MSDEITLEALFRLQDRALKYNWENSPILQKRLVFISEAVRLAYEILTSMRFAAHKQTAIRVFCGDAFSSIVTGVRVGFWGNVPESIALLRCAIETSAILAVVVEEQAYEAATLEMGTSRLRRFSYDAAVSRLGDVGLSISSTWGRLSNIGPHSTGTRMKFSSYELNGESYDRPGAALHPESAEHALSLVPTVCLHLLDSLEKSHSQDSAEFPFAERLRSLWTRFADVKNERS
ncbi:MAG: hypothetical protein HY651_05115 [Acidobacteria bacterium]|nr:hypothetical protein [Acidobacteriota bacterium]